MQLNEFICSFPYHYPSSFWPTSTTTHMMRSSQLIRNSTHSTKSWVRLSFLLYFLACVNGVHHMQRGPLAWVNRRADNRPLVIRNQCRETVYPGIGTQAGTGPATQGFQLTPGQSRSLEVSADWQGRVWGRTNCSFNAAGTAPASSGTGVACGTGDCGGTVNCRGTVRCDGTATFRLCMINNGGSRA